MSEVSFVPLLTTCPKCRHQGYMNRLVGKSIGEMNVKCLNCNSYFSLDELEKPLIEEPALTPDFVEVVRCKECKYAVMTTDGQLKYCKERDPHCTDKLYYSGDGFCSRGERK